MLISAYAYSSHSILYDLGIKTQESIIPAAIQSEIILLVDFIDEPVRGTALGLFVFLKWAVSKIIYSIFFDLIDIDAIDPT